MFIKIKTKSIFYLTRFIQVSRIIRYKILSTNRNIYGKPHLNQPLLALGNGKIEFLGSVTIGFYPSPFFFNSYAHFDTRGKNSQICIGSDSYINNNATLIADKAKIIIGKNVLVGPNLSIYTSNFHDLNPETRLSQDYPCKDVIIEDNVFLGSNVTILMGVTIGKNSVIANGAIVSKNIPQNVIAGGIPCQVIKAI